MYLSKVEVCVVVSSGSICISRVVFEKAGLSWKTVGLR